MSDSTIQKGLRYTREHEWVQVEDDVVTIGISDFAQHSLGDLVFVELPEVGKQVSQGDMCIVVESFKAASDVYAPVSGEIAEVNNELSDSPERVNESPYDEGWIIKIKMSDQEELEELMNADEYEEYLDGIEE